jgi:hypothetical protein
MGRVYKPGDLIRITHHYSDNTFLKKAEDVFCLVLKRHNRSRVTNEQRNYPLSAYLDEGKQSYVDNVHYDVLMCGSILSMPLISKEKEEIISNKISITMDVLSEC